MPAARMRSRVAARSDAGPQKLTMTSAEVADRRDPVEALGELAARRSDRDRHEGHATLFREPATELGAPELATGSEEVNVTSSKRIAFGSVSTK